MASKLQQSVGLVKFFLIYYLPVDCLFWTELCDQVIVVDNYNIQAEFMPSYCIFPLDNFELHSSVISISDYIWYPVQ